jgi:hypothetical protein
VLASAPVEIVEKAASRLSIEVLPGQWIVVSAGLRTVLRR